MLKIIISIVGVLLILIVAFVAYLSISEYKPEDTEALTAQSGNQTLQLSKDISIISYNIGYAALSQDEDFFMDGGQRVRPAGKDLINANLEGISSILKENDADIYLLQEADLNSKRSYHINQMDYLEEALDTPGIFAYNFKCNYIPYPLPTIGKVESGLLTLSAYTITNASRVSLPVPFRWPVRMCNLKRCLMVTRLPIEGADQELVLINLHLEAYDDGEGKAEQTQVLMSLMEEEYQKGNYVIAGGDFNQSFEGYDETYPLHSYDWVPGLIEEEGLPEGFRFAVDDSYPTSRVLNAPYAGNYEESQVHVIDGYIVSDNVEVNAVKVIDTQFEYTDHQPVKLTVKLK